MNLPIQIKLLFLLTILGTTVLTACDNEKTNTPAASFTTGLTHSIDSSMVITNSISLSNLVTITPNISNLLKIDTPTTVTTPHNAQLLYINKDLLYVSNPDGSKLLTLKDKVNTAVWSPDGNLIAFARANDGLYIAAADDYNSQKIASGDINKIQWSPDNKKIAYSGESSSTKVVDYKQFRWGLETY